MQARQLLTSHEQFDTAHLLSPPQEPFQPDMIYEKI